jgi:hypothetical protein
MTDSDNRKEYRRKKLQNQHRKPEVSEEQKFINKSKKNLKRQVEDLRSEEAWEDWGDNE